MLKKLVSVLVFSCLILLFSFYFGSTIMGYSGPIMGGKKTPPIPNKASTPTPSKSTDNDASSIKYRTIRSINEHSGLDIDSNGRPSWKGCTVDSIGTNTDSRSSDGAYEYYVELSCRGGHVGTFNLGATNDYQANAYFKLASLSFITGEKLSIVGYPGEGKVTNNWIWYLKISK